LSLIPAKSMAEFLIRQDEFGFQGHFKGLLLPHAFCGAGRGEWVSQLFPGHIAIEARQVHGTNVINLNRHRSIKGVSFEGDGFYTSREHWTEELSDCVLVVKTADCLGLVFESDRAVAVVHAGWRGLSQGIISEALKLFDDPFRAYIFPHAGFKRYQIGEDILDQLPEEAVFHFDPDQKRCLNLGATAEAIIRQHGLAENVMTSGICTIEDQRFYSHRRGCRSDQRNVLLLAISEKFSQRAQRER